MAGMGGEGKSASSSLALASDPTRILLGVNESSLKGYPNASISCRNAFDWTMQKIVRSNTNDFKLLFLHVHVPDDNEDGAGISFSYLYLIPFLFLLSSFFFRSYIG